MPMPVRMALLAVLSVIAIASIVVLLIGFWQDRLHQLLTLALAALAIAAFAALLQGKLPTRLGLMVAVFVGSVGALAVLLQPTTHERVDAVKLAQLIRIGPFTVRLPGSLAPTELKDAQIGDPSAAGRVGAAELDTQYLDTGERGPTAWIETYPTREAASTRASKAFHLHSLEFAQFGTLEGSPDSFCTWGGPYLICGGVRGYVYTEVYQSPVSNLHQAEASNVVSAVLQYTDEKTKLSQE